MTSWVLFGTVVNTAAVVMGSLLGLGIRKVGSGVKRKCTPDTDPDLQVAENTGKEKISDHIMRALGLSTLIIGLLGALKAQNMLIVIVSMALGTLIGTLLDLDGHINRFGTRIEQRIKGRAGSVAQGFVTATLLFCVGGMTVTGAIESGVQHVHTTYYAKSALDMVSATIFASTLGFGVLLSAPALFVCQGALTMLAVLLAGAIPEAVIGEVVAVGSLLVVAIGTNLLGVTKLKVMNFLPAMFLPIGLCPLYTLIFH